MMRLIAVFPFRLNAIRLAAAIGHEIDNPLVCLMNLVYLAREANESIRTVSLEENCDEQG
jgi:hypothetical protein